MQIYIIHVLVNKYYKDYEQSNYINILRRQLMFVEIQTSFLGANMYSLTFAGLYRSRAFTNLSLK